MDQKPTIIHEAQGLTIEQIQALYFDKNAIVEQPKTIYMMRNGSMKFYYTWNDEAFKPEHYMSVTTLIDRTMPTPRHLIEWEVKMGTRAAQQHMEERSAYGMLMDQEFGKFLIARKYNLDGIRDLVHAHIVDKKQDPNLLEDWTEELTKDMLSFNQWVINFDVEPLALQIMLVSDEYKMGGRLDLVCMKYAKEYSDKTPLADRKKVRALVDYKSGKSGFHESNEVQLEIYRRLWNENFPNNPIEQMANYSGSDFRGDPTFKFKDQTECRSHAKVDHLIEIARIDEIKPNRDVKVMGGELVYKGSMEGNIAVHNADEYIINIHRQRL